MILAILVSTFVWLAAWFFWPHPRNVRRRRWWAALLLSLLQFGCTSTQRVDASPEDLQAQIRAGKYLQPGHDVALVTRQGKEVWFRFERLDGDAIVGHTQLGEEGSVPIADVVGLTTDRLSVGRTVLAVGGGIVVACLTLLMAALAAIAS